MNKINQNLYNIFNKKKGKLKKDSTIEKKEFKMNVENMPSH